MTEDKRKKMKDKFLEDIEKSNTLEQKQLAISNFQDFVRALDIENATKMSKKKKWWR